MIERLIETVLPDETLLANDAERDGVDSWNDDRTRNTRCELRSGDDPEFLRMRTITEARIVLTPATITQKRLRRV